MILVVLADVIRRVEKFDHRLSAHRSETGARQIREGPGATGADIEHLIGCVGVFHTEHRRIDHIVDEAFRLLCNWYPVTEGVDGSKWAKFAREMKLFPDIHKPKRAARGSPG